MSPKYLFIAPAVLAIAATSASAVHVNIELSLLVDVSGSIDDGEYNLQKTGYANAFTNPNFFSSVVGTGHSVAVNYVEWSGSGQQSQLVGWTLISSQAQATAFGNAIAASVRPFNNQTAPGEAINFAANSTGAQDIFHNSFDSDKQILDVSGDGADNVDGDAFVDAARTNALAHGVDQINGLVILGEAGLQAWYNAHIKGGTGAFVNTVSNFTDFGAAIQEKLQQEITTSVPLPTTAGLGLVGLGLVGAQRRRVRR